MYIFEQESKALIFYQNLNLRYNIDIRGKTVRKIYPCQKYIAKKYN